MEYECKKNSGHVILEMKMKNQINHVPQDIPQPKPGSARGFHADIFTGRLFLFLSFFFKFPPVINHEETNRRNTEGFQFPLELSTNINRVTTRIVTTLDIRSFKRKRNTEITILRQNVPKSCDEKERHTCNVVNRPEPGRR